MMDQTYMRMARAMRDELSAESVALIVVCRDGQIHTGSAGPLGLAIAACGMDHALDLVQLRKEVGR